MNDYLSWAQYLEAGHPQLLAVRAKLHARAITSSPSARPELPRPHVLPRRAGGVGRRQSQLEPHRQPASSLLGLRRAVGHDRPDPRPDAPCTARTSFPCFNIPSVPDILPSAVHTGSSTARTSTSCARCGRCSTASSDIRHGPGWSQRGQRLSVRHRRRRTTRCPTWSGSSIRISPTSTPTSAAYASGRTGRWASSTRSCRASTGRTRPSSSPTTTSAAGTTTSPPPRQYGCDAHQPLRARLPAPAHRHLAVREAGFIFKERSEQASIPRSSRTSSARRALSTLDPAAQDGQANNLMNAFDFDSDAEPAAGVADALGLPLTRDRAHR